MNVGRRTKPGTITLRFLLHPSSSHCSSARRVRDCSLDRAPQRRHQPSLSEHESMASRGTGCEIHADSEDLTFLTEQQIADERESKLLAFFTVADHVLHLLVRPSVFLLCFNLPYASVTLRYSHNLTYRCCHSGTPSVENFCHSAAPAHGTS